jgi:hypothetical protein
MRLVEFGVDPRVFSNACLDDLCRHAVSPLFGSARANLLNNLHSIAVNVAWLCFGEGDGTSSRIKDGIERGLPNYFWEVLAKHDHGRFALDKLEHTQATNRMLREMVRSENA